MSGRLKHKIRFVSMGSTRDAFGVVNSSTETKVMDAKANVIVISGSERINQGTVLDSEYISVVLRGDTRIKHDLLLVWNGNRYTIDNIRPDDKNMKVVVQASRRVRDV